MLSSSEQDRWLRIARRYTRVGIDAADVLQEACLAATKAGRADLSGSPNQRYFRGIIRKTAWAMMRAEIRRTRHEQSQPPAGEQPTQSDFASAPDLSQLPMSLRAVANLVMANLDRDEIRAALGITDDALRRRLADLRRYIEKNALNFDEFESERLARQTLVPSDIGLIRQALIQWLRQGTSTGRAIGTVDPDGHLLAVSEKSRGRLTKPGRPATE